MVVVLGGTTRSTSRRLLRLGLANLAKEPTLTATKMVMPMQVRATRPPRRASVIQSQRREGFFGGCGGQEVGMGEPPYGSCPSGGCDSCSRGCWGCCFPSGEGWRSFGSLFMGDSPVFSVTLLK